MVMELNDLYEKNYPERLKCVYIINGQYWVVGWWWVE